MHKNTIFVYPKASQASAEGRLTLEEDILTANKRPPAGSRCQISRHIHKKILRSAVAIENMTQGLAGCLPEEDSLSLPGERPGMHVPSRTGSGTPASAGNVEGERSDFHYFSTAFSPTRTEHLA